MAALAVVATRPMMQSTIPAVAMPLRGPFRLLMPITSPVMVTGNPMMGRNQAIRPKRPRDNDAIALPPPAAGWADSGGPGNGADGLTMSVRYNAGRPALPLDMV